MKTKSRIWLPLAAGLWDFGAILGGAWLAYALRFSEWFAKRIPIVNEMPPGIWYINLSLMLAILTLILFASGGLYRFPRQDGLWEESTTAAKRFISAYLLVLAGLFFYREVSFSRVTLFLLLVFSILSLVIVRSVGRWLRVGLYGYGLAVKRSAVVGGGAQAEGLISRLKAHPEFGLRVLGTIGEQLPDTTKVKHLGAIVDAKSIIKRENIDTLIIAPGREDSESLPAIVKACYGINVDFLYLPDLLLAGDRPRRVLEVSGTPLWTMKESPFIGWPGLLKRSFDLAVSLLFLLLISPLMGLLAALIKLDSKGPVFYRQRRVGQDGREFDCLKLRSMKVGAEAETGPVWAKQNDSRVTRVGKFIRRWSLDELPQLWNVLKGEMSLVGPRPERPEFVREFSARIDGYQERHRMRSGLTGWAQVNGLRGDSSIEDRTLYDRYYVENWSLGFDLKIILLTVKAVFKGENSY